MDTRVKALVWEEFRVSGAIAACTLAAGLLLLLSFRMNFNAIGLGNNALLAPIAVALLLILNPDYSGLLAGGYSRRILHLPVPTFMTVAVTLLVRTLLVFIVTVISILAARRLFGGDPLGFEWVLFVTLLYLGAQLLDWLRAPISGLSSLLLLLLVGIPVAVFSSDEKDFKYIVSSLSESGLLTLYGSSLILGCVFVATYCTAVPAVHLARTGQQWGIPEIWDWPKRITFIPSLRAKPFSSPVAAQVWFNFRRSGWIIPIGTLSIFLLAAGAFWLRTDNFGFDGSKARIFLSILPFVGVLLAATAHSLRTNIVERSRPTGNPGYTYLQPLTDSQFAYARIIANALSLFPTVLLAVALHFSIAGTDYVMDVIPRALELGVASYREVIWTLISRGLLLGLVAWPLMAISTRLLLGVAFLLVPISTIVEIVVGLVYKWDDTGISLTPISLLLILLVVIAYARAWRQGLVPIRATCAWGFAWVLTTYLLYANARLSIEILAPTPLWHAIAFLSCIGMATLVPLPYIAVLFDVRLRRHGGKPSQAPSQHTNDIPFFWGTTRRTLTSCIAACTTVAILWLCWPVRPAYEAVWKARGRPINLSELDAWYPVVAPEENRALQYLAIVKDRAQLESEFRRTLPQDWDANIGTTDVAYYQKNLLIFGHARVKRGEAIPEKIWEVTNAYWKVVTAQLAPALKDFLADDTAQSRYPVDLRKGYWFTSHYIFSIRTLVRELRLDALHWAVTGDSRQAAESVIAIIPLANSLANEPTLNAQLSRIAILSSAQGALEDTMNRVAFDDTDLDRIQRAFEKTLPTTLGEFMLDRGMIGDTVMSLGDIKNMGISQYTLHEALILIVPLSRLIFSDMAERIVIASLLEDVLQSNHLLRAEYHNGRVLRSVSHLRKTMFIAPFSAMQFPVGRVTYRAEWRMRIKYDLALIALAVERFQLAEGRLPEALTELVPAFLAEVPVDYFSASGERIRYRRWDNGKFVVYSVGRNMEDDHGEQLKMNRYFENDITFTVDPVPERVDAGN